MAAAAAVVDPQNYSDWDMRVPPGDVLSKKLWDMKIQPWRIWETPVDVPFLEEQIASQWNPNGLRAMRDHYNYYQPGTQVFPGVFL